MFIRKLLLVLCLSVSPLLSANEKILKVELSPLPEEKNVDPERLTTEGMKKALTDFYTETGLIPADFWIKISEKKQLDKLTSKDQGTLLRPLFKTAQLEMPAPMEHADPGDVKPVTAPGTTSVSAPQSAQFRYEVDSEKAKSLYEIMLSSLPDPAEHNFFLLADIEFDEGLKWEDVGVSRAESFTGVIKDSWLKMASEHFKGFKNYAVLTKEQRSGNGINPASVTLKWTSRLKKVAEDPVKKTAKFELSAQYALIRTATNEMILAFDFPEQKREFSTSTPKQLSSGLASLIYNLLNSQSTKIATTLEGLQTSPVLEMTEVKVVSPHGLTDLYQAINWLNENLKSVQLKAELKTFSSPGSVLTLKSGVALDKLFATLSANGGKMVINEQKILLFNDADKTFAILPKDGNN